MPTIILTSQVETTFCTVHVIVDTFCAVCMVAN